MAAGVRALTGQPGDGLPSSAAWSLTWDTSASKDMGSYTATGALAFVSSDVGSVVGGSTFAAVTPAGYSATFDGSSISGWSTSVVNILGLYRVGNAVVWVVNGVQLIREIATPVAPVNTLPTIVTAVAGSAVVWTGASATGTPTPTTTFAWLTSADVLVQDNITSGSYTPPAAGSFKLRMTSTNSAGTDVDTLAVTVTAGIAPLTSIFTASGVTQGAAGAYTITGAGLKGSSSVSAAGDFTLIANFTGTGASIAAGVAVSNTAGTWTGGFNFAVIDDVGGSRWAYIEGGSQQNTLETWSSTAANRRARVRRVGTTVYMEASNDAGATWIVLRTTTDTSGTRYPVIGSFTTGGALALSGQGFA